MAIQPKIPADIFEIMKSTLRQDRAIGVDVVFHFAITGPNGGDWFMKVKDLKCYEVKGQTAVSSVTLRTSDDDLVALATGSLDPMTAISSERLKFEGDWRKFNFFWILFEPRKEGETGVSKLKFGPGNILFPVVTVLVGTNVGGKPNYITIGAVGYFSLDMISISVARNHYSTPGIRENGTFSVNQPSASMVKKLDYCGLHSGRKVDKAALFETFYGELQTVPMIKECPVNLECRVIQTMERSTNTIFIADIVQTYVDDNCLIEGAPDISKIDPVFYSPIITTMNYGSYFKLGDYLAEAWKIGKE